jgi:threonine dehydratase
MDDASSTVHVAANPPRRAPYPHPPVGIPRAQRPLWRAGAAEIGELQLTGSFKIRGALHALLAMDAAQRRRGVVTYSSGNMGRAVATLARQMGFACVIIVPADIPAAKLTALRDLGAELIINDGSRDRLAIARELEATRGMTILAGGHEDVIAGQGTVALEIMAQLTELPEPPARLDTLIVPCASGGLAAGCALALPPTTRLILVEAHRLRHHPAFAGDRSAGLL